MSAVAIATPGMTLFALSRRVLPMMPAKPPATATITSKKPGDVRASSSVLGALTGERIKYSVETSRLTIT